MKLRSDAEAAGFGEGLRAVRYSRSTVNQVPMVSRSIVRFRSKLIYIGKARASPPFYPGY
jgi:hypothetical protein